MLLLLRDSEALSRPWAIQRPTLDIVVFGEAVSGCRSCDVASCAQSCKYNVYFVEKKSWRWSRSLQVAAKLKKTSYWDLVSRERLECLKANYSGMTTSFILVIQDLI